MRDKGSPRVSGFTIVRNAERLEYPFRESVCSALPLCDEFIINCGDSEDATLALCESLQREFPNQIKLITSRWEKTNQAGGQQLRQQTDKALSLCRNPWCLYLQADEVLHEEDYPAIERALKKANSNPLIDGIVFDYLHFYVSYAYLIRGRNWYRREVRLFRNGRKIFSYRDAQGFRKEEKKLLAIPGEARIFHYGYVRPPSSLRTKSIEMSQWWGKTPRLEDRSFTPVRHVGLTRFRKTHPKVMQTRIADYDFHFEPRLYQRKWDKNEIKNALTLLWEKIFPFRIGEFRNYELID